MSLSINEYIAFNCVNLTVLISSLSGGRKWEEVNGGVVIKSLVQNGISWNLNFSETISIALSFCLLTWLTLEQLEIYLILNKRTSMKRIIITKEIKGEVTNTIKKMLFDHTLEYRISNLKLKILSNKLGQDKKDEQILK